jgi:hypothetical protein
MKQKFVFTAAFLLFIILSLNAQDDKFKALFMYNFTKYLEWPTAKQSGDFIIGVYGASPIVNELNIIAQIKTVGAKKIVVRTVTDESQIISCNIVYVPESKSEEIQVISNGCKGKGTVLITDKPGLARSFSGINYVKVDGKQNFEINKANIEGQGVKVNSVLLSLGINVQ